MTEVGREQGRGGRGGGRGRRDGARRRKGREEAPTGGRNSRSKADLILKSS